MLTVELSIVFFLTLLNGLLAMSELAIVSSRPARLRQMIERNVIGSRRALALASDPGRFLSTVQIGITLVGVLSGAFSGATLGLRLTDWLMGLGVPDRLADVIGIGIVVAAITYLSLIVGELVPKRIALTESGGHCRARRAGDDVSRQDHVAAGLASRYVGSRDLAPLGTARSDRATKSPRTKSGHWSPKPNTPACSSPARRR